jgi:hypothetical protein
MRRAPSTRLGPVVGTSDRAAVAEDQASPRRLQRERRNSIINSIISVIVFDALFVFLAYCGTYDLIGLVLLLIFVLFVFLFVIAAVAISTFWIGDKLSSFSFGIAFIICLLIGMRPHVARYEADLARFVINRGHYVADVEKGRGGVKTYSWKQAGGVFTQPIFVDLVFDPRGTGEWTQEVKNLEAARPEQYPEWLTDDHCKHDMEVMPEHFYVVTSVCEWP